MEFKPITRKAVPLALLPVAIAAIVLLLVPDAQPVAAPRVPRLVAPPPDRVILQDGTILEGEVQSQSPTHATVRLPDGTVRLVKNPSDVKRGVLTRRSPLRQVTLRNGRSFSAEVLSEANDVVELRLATGTLVTLRADEIARIDEAKGGK